MSQIKAYKEGFHPPTDIPMGFVPIGPHAQLTTYKLASDGNIGRWGRPEVKTPETTQARRTGPAT